jgi:hypothetical protein
MTDFLVEHAIVLIDICNVALILVKPLAGKLALLVDTSNENL